MADVSFLPNLKEMDVDNITASQVKATKSRLFGFVGPLEVGEAHMLRGPHIRKGKSRKVKEKYFESSP